MDSNRFKGKIRSSHMMQQHFNTTHAQDIHFSERNLKVYDCNRWRNAYPNKQTTLVTEDGSGVRDGRISQDFMYVHIPV